MTDKEKLLDCARRAEIEVGDYTITRVYDYGQVRNFLNLLEGNVHLGMDMSWHKCSAYLLYNNDMRLEICCFPCFP